MNSSDAMRLAQLLQDGTINGRIHNWTKSALDELADRWAAAGLIPDPGEDEGGPVVP
jgi:hypothetical protein